MAVYKDINSSVRIGGGLTLPSGSISLGSKITLDNSSGQITATKFSGDGSLLTGLSSANMSGVLLLDGTRSMAGNFTLPLNGTNGYSYQINLKDSGHYIRHQQTGTDATLDGIRVAGYSGVELVKGSDTTLLAVFRSTAANINAPLTVLTSVTSTTINATSNLQENGTNLSAKYVTLSGGTMTGGLTATSFTSSGDITLNAAGTATSSADQWSRVVKFNSSHWSGTAAVTYSGYLQLDNNGGFYFATNGSGSNKPVLTVDNTGNTVASANVKATSFSVGSTTVIDTNGKVDWTYLKSVPSTFAPSAHTHASSDITSVATQTFIGRNSTGSGAAEQLTMTTARTMLNVTDGATKVESSTNGNIKINGADTTVYTHPTTDGNLHVPATSTTNNNKVLKAGSTAGSISWGSVAWSEISSVPSTFTPSSHTHAYTDVISVPTSSILGRVSTGTGATEALTAAQVRTLINVADGANNYSHPTGDGNLHVPATSTTNNNKVLKAGSTAGALSWGSVAWGEISSVPSTFTPSAHTHAYTDVISVPTSSILGRVSASTGATEALTAAQVRTLINVADGANNYTHPTGDGNLHIPANGTTNANKVLKATATAGVYNWANVDWTELTSVPSSFTPAAHTHAYTDVVSVPTASILGRKSAGSGATEALTKSDVLTLLNVADGANNYVHPTGDGNKHVPADSGTNANKVLKATSTAGSPIWGSVAWGELTSVPTTFTPAAHTHPYTDVNNVPTTTILGRKSTGTGATEALTKTDVLTLINVADGANNYVHPSGDGNLHVPATGTSNNGKFLKAGSTAGSISWVGVDWSDVANKPTYDNYQNWKLSVNTEGTPATISSGATVDFKAGSNVTISRSANTVTISSSYTDTNTWRPIDDTPTDGSTTTSISSNWAYDHKVLTGNGGHVPAAGTAGQFLAYDGTWQTPPASTDTNNYLTGVSGSGNGTVTFTRSGLGDLTWDSSHTHDYSGTYFPLHGKADDADKLDGQDSTYYATASAISGLGYNYSSTFSVAVGFAESWFKVSTASNDIVSLQIMGSYDNSQFKDNITVTIFSYNMKHHITSTTSNYNGSKLLEVKTNNNGGSSTTEIWIRMAACTTSAGSFTVRSTHSIPTLAAATPTFGGNGIVNLLYDNTNITDSSLFITRGIRIDGNTVWHGGNFTPSSYLASATANQSIASGFTINGTAYIGSTSSGTNNGDLVVRGGGNATIHLDGDSSGSINNTVKSYIAGNGNATFGGTVGVNKLTVTDSTMVSNLNAEQFQGKRPYDFDTPITNADMGGYGVFSGLRPKQDNTQTANSNLRVEPGVAYTSSGRRFEFTSDTTFTVVAAASTGDRWDIVYVRGPKDANGNADPSNEGVMQYMTGVVGGAVPTPPTGSVLITKVLLKAGTGAGTVYDGFSMTPPSGTGANLIDIRQWRPYGYDGTTFTFNGTINASTLKESGTSLVNKYASLGLDNSFIGNQNISGRVSITSSGTLGGSIGTNYYLKVTDGSATLALDPNEVVTSADMNLNAGTNVIVKAGSSGTSSIDLQGKVKAGKNATTVTIPAGSTSVTWTHSYGSASYAVQLTSNSFERHVRWNSKANDTISIEIDSPTTQDILVDCILIGY